MRPDQQEIRKSRKSEKVGNWKKQEIGRSRKWKKQEIGKSRKSEKVGNQKKFEIGLSKKSRTVGNQ